jgi:predicted ArsR family transcriptional regulator
VSRRADIIEAMLTEVVASREHVHIAAVIARPQPGTARHRILIRLAERPSTDPELADELGMNPSTVRPRRVELVLAGLVEAAGARRRCTIWQVTTEGAEVART